MIFIIPCKYIENCLIEQCIAAIRQFHEHDTIVVVDSDSYDKSYFKKLEKYNVRIEDIANKNYEPGAFWYVVQNDYSSRYVLLQDSMILKTSVNKFTGLFQPFMNFIECARDNHMRSDPNIFLDSINTFLGDFSPIKSEQSYVGTFGSSFIIHESIIDVFIKRNLHNTFKPVNKYEHQIAERVFGIAAARCGVDVYSNTIIGNLHELMPVYLREDKMDMPIMNKIWMNKHRS